MRTLITLTSRLVARWPRMLGSRRRVAATAGISCAVLLLPVLLVDHPALAGPAAWVFASDTSLSSSDGQEDTDAHPDRTNLCEGTIGIPFGDDPGWARVGGNPNPHAPVTEAHGQVFPDLSDIGIKKTNP